MSLPDLIASCWTSAGAAQPLSADERSPESLTDREREIAALAAQGLSARAIGQRLHIGERTVESHLARVYGKFGVHSRQELLQTLAGQNYRSFEPTKRIHS